MIRKTPAFSKTWKVQKLSGNWNSVDLFQQSVWTHEEVKLNLSFFLF